MAGRQNITHALGSSLKGGRNPSCMAWTGKSPMNSHCIQTYVHMEAADTWWILNVKGMVERF
jgi:hypothetical protein